VATHPVEERRPAKPQVEISNGDQWHGATWRERGDFGCCYATRNVPARF
jgi:hypothetical protein